MLRKLAVLVILGVCAWQQWRIQDLTHGLQRDQQVLDDMVWEVPSPPNIARDEALYNLEHPREQ